MNKLTFPNVAAAILLIFIAVAVTYTFYDAAIKPDQTAALRRAVIESCERNRARSILDQQFALEAAKARRRNAELLFIQGKKISAENEIATAKVYEKIADGYAKLTPADCSRAYPTT